MKAMDKAFTRVDETFEAIRDSLNQQAINNIARKLAQDLRRAQQARIRSQKAPDGTAWTPRRRRVTRIQERIRFIWNNETRTLKNWHHDTGKYGRTITGWDEDKNNIRTFYRDDIDRFLEIRTRRINQDSTKHVPMFVKLRTARYLKASADASGVTVGTAAWPHVLHAFISSVNAIRLRRVFSPITRYVSCWVSVRRMSA